MCSYDKLTIYDGNSTSDSILLGPSCGTNVSGTSLASSWNTVLVEFQSDEDVERAGFLLEYEHERE